MSYSGDPSASDLDEVRFLSGDTDTDEELATDNEINYCIAEAYNNVGAAVLVCEYIAAKYSREVDARVGAAGELNLKLSQISEQYSLRAQDLKKRLVQYASPWAGSISIDDKQSQEDDTDRVEPMFKRDQFDDPQVNASSISDWDNEGPI